MNLDKLEVHLQSLFDNHKPEPKGSNERSSLIPFLMEHLQQTMEQMEKRLKKSNEKLRESEDR